MNSHASRHNLDFNTKTEILKFMETRCHKLDETRAEYDSPWTDELIWKECQKRIDPHITINHVKSVRVQRFGVLAPAKGGIARSKKNASHILDLALQVNALAEWASKRKDNPFIRPPLQLDV